MAKNKILFLALSTAGLVAAAFGWYSGGQSQSEADQLFALLELKAGASVAEIGAGKGEMTFLAAQRVGPTGHVYSTEIDRHRLRTLREKASREKLEHVTVIEAGDASTNLPDGCCEAIFMRDVYHHLTHPVEIDQSLLRALRTGGQLAIVDFPPKWYLRPWKPKGVPANRGGHGIPEAVLASELTAAGFQIVRVIEKWDGGTYCILARKGR